MFYKIQAATKQLRPLRGSQDQETLYTGLRINDQWYNIKGDHRTLYNKSVDLELEGQLARFTNPQTPPAPAQQPPAPRPQSHSQNGHTPKWPTRDDAVDAYVFYVTELGGYITEQAALVRAVNCMMMMEKDGEINPVHRIVNVVNESQSEPDNPDLLQPAPPRLVR